MHLCKSGAFKGGFFHSSSLPLVELAGLSVAWPATSECFPPSLLSHLIPMVTSTPLSSQELHSLEKCQLQSTDLITPLSSSAVTERTHTATNPFSAIHHLYSRLYFSNRALRYVSSHILFCSVTLPLPYGEVEFISLQVGVGGLCAGLDHRIQSKWHCQFQTQPLIGLAASTSSLEQSLLKSRCHVKMCDCPVTMLQKPERQVKRLWRTRHLYRLREPPVWIAAGHWLRDRVLRGENRITNVLNTFRRSISGVEIRIELMIGPEKTTN